MNCADIFFPSLPTSFKHSKIFSRNYLCIHFAFRATKNSLIRRRTFAKLRNTLTIFFRNRTMLIFSVTWQSRLYQYKPTTVFVQELKKKKRRQQRSMEGDEWPKQPLIVRVPCVDGKPSLVDYGLLSLICLSDVRPSTDRQSPVSCALPIHDAVVEQSTPMIFISVWLRLLLGWS